MIGMAFALLLQAGGVSPPALAPAPAPPLSTPPSGQSQPPGPGHPPEGAMHGLIAIFDMVCNRLFPDDQALNKLDAASGLRSLKPSEVGDFLGKDPGRGWITAPGQPPIIITVEAPPIHACAVRMLGTDGEIDEAMWGRIVDAAKRRSGGGFTAMPPQDIVLGTMQTHVIGEQKRNADGSAETFYLMRMKPADPKKAPNAGIELRLVHQMVAATR